MSEQSLDNYQAQKWMEAQMHFGAWYPRIKAGNVWATRAATRLLSYYDWGISENLDTEPPNWEWWSAGGTRSRDGYPDQSACVLDAIEDLLQQPMPYLGPARPGQAEEETSDG